MKTPAPLFMITDNAREAALTMFAREPDFLPPFITIITDMAKLMALPTGSRAFSLWFSSNCFLNEIWREQRHRFDLGIGWQFWDEIQAWRDGSVPLDIPDSSASQSAPKPVAPSIPVKRQSRWS